MTRWKRHKTSDIFLLKMPRYEKKALSVLESFLCPVLSSILVFTACFAHLFLPLKCGGGEGGLLADGLPNRVIRGPLFDLFSSHNCLFLPRSAVLSSGVGATNKPRSMLRVCLFSLSFCSVLLGLCIPACPSEEPTPTRGSSVAKDPNGSGPADFSSCS